MDGRNVYACVTADRPRHLTANIDIYRWVGLGAISSKRLPVSVKRLPMKLSSF